MITRSSGALVLLLSAAACAGPSSPRRYELRGQIIGIQPERREVLIKHEAINGFMPAMTMPFAVRDPTLLDGRAPGDLVTATLEVTREGARLTTLFRTGSAPVDAPPPAPAASSGFELLTPGEAVPDETFRDQTGRAVRLASLRGSSVALTFIYTRCPIPTFCPLMDRHFATIQRAVKGDPALRGRVRLVSISFDPVNDTPAVLARHARDLDADPRVWSFLTGDRDDIDRFASRFGVTVARAEDDPGTITHNLRTAVIDPDGRLLKVYTGNEWEPDDVLRDLRSSILNPSIQSSMDRPSMSQSSTPPLSAFNPDERRIIGRFDTPLRVQRFLNALPYNVEPPPGRATLRSFRGIVRHGCAHCLESALAAAVILEQHGYPPLLLSFESIDALDHVIFLYRRRGRWGSVARSRDPGLHGRRPVFATPRALAVSYLDPYIDFTGRITGYAVVDLRTLGDYDWRLSEQNVWKVERVLLDYPHRPLRSSDRRVDRLRARYRAFRARYPGRKPLEYRGREKWTELPSEFLE